MPPRITYKGQQYNGVEAMPPEVRRAFEQTLSHLTGGDPAGAEVLGNLTGNNVIAVEESSITLNGKNFPSIADLPPSVRWLFEYAQRQAAADRGEFIEPSAAPSEGREWWLRALDSTQYTLGTILQVITGFIAGAVIVGGVWLIVHMDAGSKSQGGGFYVMLGVLAALLWVGGIFMNLWWRRQK